MRQGIKHNIKKDGSYFLTLTTIGWVDLFARKELRDILIDSMGYCVRHKGLNVFAYCIMTNHLHLIVNTSEPFELKDTIRDFKRHTSSTIFSWVRNNSESRREWLIPMLKQAGSKDSKNKTIKVWQTGNHAIELVNSRFTWVKVQYIHDNPVRAGWVTRQEDWVYSSARNYMELDAMFRDVICLTPPLNMK